MRSSPIIYFSPNKMGRDFVLGDLHGCYSAFMGLLDHVQFRPAVDRVFAVGDLVDRGPSSLDCLELLQKPWFFSCRGNHEQMLLDCLKHPFAKTDKDPPWLKKITKTMIHRQKFAGKWVSILDRMPYVIFVGDKNEKFLIVHAEILEDGKSVTEKMILDWSFKDSKKAKHRALWGRALLKAYEKGKNVNLAHDPSMPFIYCGHTILPKTMIISKQVYIDGGAYLASTPHLLNNSSVKDPTLRMVEVKKNICWSFGTCTGNISFAKIPPSIAR